MNTQTVYPSVPQSFSFVDIQGCCSTGVHGCHAAAYRPAVITVKMSRHVGPGWPLGSDARARLMQVARK